MAIIEETNSLLDIVKYTPIRCDTHFKYNIKLANHFFENNSIEWVSLGSILKNIRNGMNISTDYYSMEATNYEYISVSQIKEYGLAKKNQNFLMANVTKLKNFFEIKENMLLVTRSGTIGVAISSSHPSFDYEEKTYVASGFVITAEMQEGFSAKLIANYMNLYPVQRYLIAMSSGACQKNISQPVIANLPIPSSMLLPDNKYQKLFDEYEDQSKEILKRIEVQERKLEDIKRDISDTVLSEIEKDYR